MSDVNAVVLRGNLAAEPEVKYSRQGTPYALLRVATKGHRQDAVDYHRVVAWGSLAEQAGQATKGDRLELSGSLHTRSWEAPDGSRRYVTEVRAHTIKVRRSRRAPQPPTTQPEPPAGDAAPADDLPF